MRAEIIRAYKQVHTWTGISTGLALFIAFYAGALTMFEQPLERWVAPPRVEHPSDLSKAPELINRTLALRPEVAREFTLHLTSDGPTQARLTWQKGRHDRSPWSAELQENGSLLIHPLHPSVMPQFIDVIHRTAGMPGDEEVGEVFMGIVSIVYALALISGLIILLPSLIKDFFALRVGKNIKRMWLDAHNLAGITGFPFHLFIALTSIVFCLHDSMYWLQNHLIYDGQFRTVTAQSNPYAKVNKDKSPAVMLSPELLLQQVRALSAEFEPTSIQYKNANSAGASARISGNDPRYLIRHSGFVVLGAVTGEVLNTEYFPGAQSNWSAVVSSFFALHFGSYGGDTIRWLYFFLGLSGAFLFYSGNLLWLETRRAKGGEGATASRSCRILAAITVGVCLGCVAGLSATIAAGKWLSGHVSDPGYWHAAIYYSLFLGCCGWALGLGAARASVHLLKLAALSCLLIPLSSLCALLIPQAGGWVNASAWGVDLLAFLAAVLLFLIAGLTSRRVANAKNGSLWSVSKRCGPAVDAPC